MRLSVNAFLSLDGVMQGPGGPDEDRSGGFERGGWLVPFTDDDMGEIVEQDWFGEAEAILLGRTTYQMMQPYWEAVTDPENAVATILNTYPKYLASTTLTDEDVTWAETTLLEGLVVDSVGALKELPGGELQVHGSLRLARTLHDAGLVDVYRLLIFPVVVGAGRRLFDAGSRPASFEVVDRKATASGATALTLHPRDFATGGFAVEDGHEAEV